MNLRTLVFMIGATLAAPAAAESVPHICVSGCDGSPPSNPPPRHWDHSNDDTPSAPSESLADRKRRLKAEAGSDWESRAPDRRSEWAALRAPTQRLIAQSDRLRSRGLEVIAPDKSTRMFMMTSGVGRELKGKERDTAQRVLTTAWAQLDCATKIAASVFEEFEKSPEDAVYLADEAQNALNGATKGIACAPGAPPAGYGVPATASHDELKEKMRQTAEAIGAYQAAAQTRATLGLVGDQQKKAAAAAASAAAEAKVKAQEARRKGLRDEELQIQQAVQRQKEVQKREEERSRKIFEEQKKNEEAMAAALAALKAGNVFRSKGKQP